MKGWGGKKEAVVFCVPVVAFRRATWVDEDVNTAVLPLPTTNNAMPAF